MIPLNQGSPGLLSTTPENRKFPWPELPPGFFGDLGGSGQSSPPKTKWGRLLEACFLAMHEPS